MCFRWSAAHNKKESSLNPPEETVGRGLARFLTAVVAVLIGALIVPGFKAEALADLDQGLTPKLLSQIFPGAQGIGAV